MTRSQSLSVSFLSRAVAVASLVAGLTLRAGSVWTGPAIIYDQPAPVPTQVTNQDHLTPKVWLTRAASKGLFNAYSETNATALSPADTEWAFGTLDQHASLNYTNWLAWLNGQSPTTLVGQPVVLHLVSEDIYLSVQFTNWVPGGSGGFAYERSTPSPTSLSGTEMVGGDVVFGYNADAGFSYVIESSSNLVNWLPLATNTAIGNPAQFSGAFNAMAGVQFYRVQRLTNF